MNATQLAAHFSSIVRDMQADSKQNNEQVFLNHLLEMKAEIENETWKRAEAVIDGMGVMAEREAEEMFKEIMKKIAQPK